MDRNERSKVIKAFAPAAPDQLRDSRRGLPGSCTVGGLVETAPPERRWERLTGTPEALVAALVARLEGLLARLEGLLARLEGLLARLEGLLARLEGSLAG